MSRGPRLRFGLVSFLVQEKVPGTNFTVRSQPTPETTVPDAFFLSRSCEFRNLDVFQNRHTGVPLPGYGTPLGNRDSSSKMVLTWDGIPYAPERDIASSNAPYLTI